MNSILFERASIVSISLKKDSTNGETFLANIRIADSKYKSSTEREKAKNEGKETDNFFTLNIWKNEIQKFNKAQAEGGHKIEDLIPGCRIKFSGRLINNNYMSGETKVYKDVIVVDSIEILSFPKPKDESAPAESGETNTDQPEHTPTQNAETDSTPKDATNSTENADGNDESNESPADRENTTPDDFQEEIPESNSEEMTDDAAEELGKALESGEVTNPFEGNGEEDEELPF